MRFHSKGRHALWLVVSVAFVVLVFAAGAQASGTNGLDAAAEAPPGEAVTESGASPEAPPAAEQAPPAAEAVPPVVEQEPSTTAEETPPVAEQAPPVAAEVTPPPAEAAPPAAEQAPPAAEAAPPAGEQEPSTAAEEPPPVAEQAPVVAEVVPPPPLVEQAPPVVAEVVPPPTEAVPPTTGKAPPVDETASPAEKKTVEQTPGGVATGADSEGAVSQHPGGSSPASAGASGPTHNDAASEVTSEASIAATTSAVLGVPLEISTVHDGSSRAQLSRTVSVRRAGQASCEPVTIGASIAADEAGGWLELAAAASVSTTNFAAVDSSRSVNTAGAPAGSQGVGSAVANHPSAPTPGPWPGGAGGGSAAAGGSGSTSSATFTLVGALLQTAPRAIRRFRLAQPSWRTSFFVLIPERPD
jgi:hypothetical protein